MGVRGLGSWVQQGRHCKRVPGEARTASNEHGLRMRGWSRMEEDRPPGPPVTGLRQGTRASPVAEWMGMAA